MLQVNGMQTPVTPRTLNSSEAVESPRVLESADVTEDEGDAEGGSSTVYSNPMITAEDEEIGRASCRERV